jgi:predicted DNA-binding transcriptional regulator YafY
MVALPQRIQRSADPGRGLLRRAAWALARLRAGLPLKASDLASHFEISLRTAYRDLDFLRDEWRVPLEFDRSQCSFQLTEPTTLLIPVTLSRGEAVAMQFAERVLAQYRGTPFEADLRSAFRKVRDLLPEHMSVSTETMDAMLSLDLGPVNVPDVEIFRTLLTAHRQRLIVRVIYRSLASGRTRTRLLRPYHFFNHRGDWYVAAWDSVRRDVRDFALHRIRRITVTTASYDIPDAFDLRAYLARGLAVEKGGRKLDVAIRFGPDQGRWIRERRWHPTSRIQGTIDGGCVLRMTVAGADEVCRWVLQFGGEAEVLSPASLRDRVARELSRASAAYRQTETLSDSPSR